MNTLLKSMGIGGDNGDDVNEVDDDVDTSDGEPKVKRRNREAKEKRKAKSERHKRRMNARQSMKNADLYYQDEVEEEEEERTQRMKAQRQRRVEHTRNIITRSQKNDEEYDEDVEMDINDGNNEREGDEDDPERARRERIEQLLEERMRGDINARPVYTSSVSESPEKAWALYDTVKAIGYFLFMTAAFYIATFNYDKRECKQGTTATNMDICFQYNETHKCVGLDDTTCANLCNSLRSQFIGEGCMVSYNFTITGTTSEYTCLDNSEFTEEWFEGGCRDTLTCSDTDEKAIVKTVVFVGLVYLFTLVILLSTIIGYVVFSEWHPTDFVDLERRYIILFFVTKHGPLAEQIAWIVQIFSNAYYVFIVFQVASACNNSVTSTGAPNQFSKDIENFAIYNSIFIGTLGLIGTYLRVIWLYSGWIARVSFERKVHVPFNLDCVEQRRKDAPKCCHDTVEMCIDESLTAGCPIGCRYCCTHCCDASCALFLMFGTVIHVFYKYRHFIGP